MKVSICLLLVFVVISFADPFTKTLDVFSYQTLYKNKPPKKWFGSMTYAGDWARGGVGQQALSIFDIGELAENASSISQVTLNMKMLKYESELPLASVAVLCYRHPDPASGKYIKSFPKEAPYARHDVLIPGDIDNYIQWEVTNLVLDALDNNVRYMGIVCTIPYNVNNHRYVGFSDYFIDFSLVVFGE